METMKINQSMNEGFKKSTKDRNDFLSQYRLPYDKSGIGFSIIQKAENKSLKFSQGFDHGDGSNEREDHIHPLGKII